MNKLMTKRLTGQLSLHSRRPLMTNESGRSMVEMLGVLAIVGILSAGGLAGFSKAMLWHRSNIQLEQFDALFSAILQYYDKFEKPDRTISMTENFINLNAIPGEMILENDVEHIYDSFKNKLQIQASPTRTYLYIFSTTESSDVKNINTTTCMNFVKVAKAYENDIDTFGIYGRWPDIKEITMSMALEWCQSEPRNSYNYLYVGFKR